MDAIRSLRVLQMRWLQTALPGHVGEQARVAIEQYDQLCAALQANRSCKVTFPTHRHAKWAEACAKGFDVTGVKTITCRVDGGATFEFVAMSPEQTIASLPEDVRKEVEAIYSRALRRDRA